MESATFERFRQLIYRESGIVLTPQKRPLLSSRIQKRMMTLGLSDESHYLQIIETDKTGAELIQLLDAVSTNVTYFYREPDHFPQYREVLERRIAAGTPRLTVWCAAASSGEEPYTLAFEALDTLGSREIGFRLLGTDISLKVLRHADRGFYPTNATEAVPAALRQRFMSAASGGWQVKPEVRDRILFKRMNLVDHPYPLNGPFDVIFCRNVMIYFDNPTRERIVREFERLLAPGGYLFLSHSENLLGVTHSLQKISASVFRRGER